MAAAPQSAYAACTVTTVAGDNVIRCDTVVTVNTAYPTNAVAGTDRVYNWTALPGFGIINAGTIFPVAGNPSVTGAGLEFNGFTGGGAGVDVTFNNLDSGTINQTVVPTIGPSAQTGALSLITRGGGNITYTGNGSITATGAAAGDAALQATVLGTGNINIGTLAQPISGATFTGSDAIVASSATGNINMYLNGGTVTATGAANEAILASTAGGNTTMVLTGNTALVNGSGGVNNTFGIRVASGSVGDVDITSNANIGAGGGSPMNIGIAIGNGSGVAGNVNIELTGGTITYANGVATGQGINARTTTGNIGVTMDNGSLITGTGAGSSGIFVQTLGAGNIDVTMNAGSKITGSGAGSFGINAQSSGATSGGITVVTNGIIDPPAIGVNMQITNAANNNSISYTNGPNGNISATNTGVNATTVGGGNIFIVNQGVITAGPTGGLTDGGINASATTGQISINSAGAVTSNNDAIRAATTTGAITITTGAAAITGDTNGGGAGAAIFATSAGGNISVTSGSGNLTGNEPGTTPAGTGGVVHLVTTGAGTIGVNIGTGGVTGTAAAAVDGILTSAVNGQTSIVTNGVVQTVAGGAGAGAGIRSTSTGTGGISVTANAAVIGATQGIIAQSTGGGAISVGATAPVTGNGGEGIFASSGGAAGATANNVIVSTSNTVTGTTFGINTGLTNPGTGNIIVTTTGPVTATAAGSTGINSFINNGSGNIEITAGDVSGGGTAVSALSGAGQTGGNISITVNGAATATTGTGISAVIANAANAGNVAVTTHNVTANGAGAKGVNATTAGAGNVTVDTTLGTVSATGAGGVGINATGTGGNVTVSSGIVTANANAINATTTGGAGNVTVTTLGTVTSTTADGINAQVLGAGTGGVSVTTGGAVSGVTGINATTAGAGLVNVVTKAGPVTGTGGTAINAASTGDSVFVDTGIVNGNINASANAATGTATVTTEGPVTGNITASGNTTIITVLAGATGTVTGNAGAGGASIDTEPLPVGAIVATSTNSIFIAAADVTTGGIDADSVNGPITIAKTGTVTNVAGIGVDAEVTSAAGTGAIAVTTNGAVTGSTTGINATNAGSGGTTVNAFSTVTGQAGGGINAAATTGDVNVTALQAVTGTLIGINTTTTTGNINVTTGGGAITGNSAGGQAAPGILATSTGGNIAIATGAGLVSGSSITGSAGSSGAISASTTGAGSISVLVGSGGVLGTLGSANVFTDGISTSAVNGNTTIVTNGVVNAPLAGSFGIFAQATGTGAINVTNNAAVNADSTGINTTATSGATQIVANANVTSTNDDGIAAASTTGNIGITSASGVTITGSSNGISANSAGGSIAVATGGPVVGGAGGTGILAISNLAGGTGNVSVTTSSGSPVTAGIGIDAEVLGAGNTGKVTVVTFDSVTGTVGDGIHAVSVAGDIVIETHGTVTGNVANAGSDGIDASSTTGNVSITTFGAVSGDPGITVTTGGNINLLIGAPVTGATTGISLTGTGATSSILLATTANAPVVGQTVDGIIATLTNAADTNGITITTDGTVTGAVNGINATEAGSGQILVNGLGSVTAGTGTGVIATSAGGGNIIVDKFGTISGTSGIFASTNGPGTILVNANADVTGTGGNGITTANAGGTNTVNVKPNVTVTGTGSTNSGISASTATGAIAVNVDPLAVVTNTTGRGVSLNTDTGAATGTATLTNGGHIVGLGSILNPTIFFNNNNSAGPITINNGASGVITNAIGGGNNPAGWFITPGTATASADTQPIHINNDNLIIGRLILGAGDDTFNNNSGAVWNLAGTAGADNQFGAGNDLLNNALGGIINATTTNFDFGAGADTLTNAGLFNANGTVNFFNLENINNNGLTGQGIFNVGSAPGVLGEQTNFSSGPTATTAGGVQTVDNSGVFNVLALQPQVGLYRGSLNFFGAGGSSFTNTGLINMQADGGSTRNATTLNTVGMTGTSDLNYTYTWAGALAGNSYNWTGGANSRLWVDTFLGAPGSTSDRLVVGGSTSGNTVIKVNDTNPGPGALNLTGITVVAQQGGGSTSFRVDPSTPKYVNFGPLGAIDKGFFVYPLIFVPNGATSTGGLPNGNAYKFFGVPGPFAFNLPVAHTAAQNIWQETALLWEDRQNEVRGLHSRGISLARSAPGGGADLPVKAAPRPVVVSEVETGMWLKAIGSWTSRSATADFGQILPALGVLNISNSYKQETYGVIAGWDVGRTGVFGRTDSVVFELMGGYLNSHLTFDQPNNLVGPASFTKFDWSGATVGVSGTYMNGGWFASALAKVDLLDLKIGGIPGAFCTSGTASCNPSVDSTTWGVVGDFGYRAEFGRYFFEPLFTVQYINSHIDSLSLPGAGVTADFGHGDSTRLAGGFRAGGVVFGDRIRYLETSLTARVWDQVSGHNSVDFINPGLPFTLTDKFDKVWGETALSFDWINTGPGWSGFTKFGAKYNEEFLTLTGKGGMRYQW